MKTYTVVVTTSRYERDKTVSIAAKSFLEAIEKSKNIMRKKGFLRVEFVSVVRTAVLDA